MLATVILCLLSTISFCLCARGLVVVFTAPRGVSLAVDRRGFSIAAKRLARVYFAFALALLAGLSFAGAVLSYFELFS